MLLTGTIDFITHTAYGWIGFGICSVLGLVIIIRAQVKYNGGLF